MSQHPSFTRPAWWLGAASLALAVAAQAGELTPPAGPTDAASAMHSLQDVCDRLEHGTLGSKRTGAFTEPSGAPGPTGCTIDRIMALIPQVARTGQTVSDATGDDGDLRKGRVWPDPRFTDNGDGTVTDELTGLVWLEDANCPASTKSWADALGFVAALDNSQCSLSDGSSAGQWRLPNVRELESLVDYSQKIPALPLSVPFVKVSSVYWSSTTYANNWNNAWTVNLNYGITQSDVKTNAHYVWAVRDKH